ncbi:hypothetical protein VTK73DRAFT_10200 [Phialemonium thermophilum]|uniref:Uncharacterized protein n=1 Tax=Phialemonium thermophilum TaxID=223376 RepID=A0ABR3XH60_9PEZI
MLVTPKYSRSLPQPDCLGGGEVATGSEEMSWGPSSLPMTDHLLPCFSPGSSPPTLNILNAENGNPLSCVLPATRMTVVDKTDNKSLLGCLGTRPMSVEPKVRTLTWGAQSLLLLLAYQSFWFCGLRLHRRYSHWYRTLHAWMEKSHSSPQVVAFSPCRTISPWQTINFVAFQTEIILCILFGRRPQLPRTNGRDYYSAPLPSFPTPP